MTPCSTALPLESEGRGPGPARAVVTFSIASDLRVQPAYPPPCWHTTAHSDPLPAPTLDIMCSPFRLSRSFQPEGELVMLLRGGGLPPATHSSLTVVGVCRLPRAQPRTAKHPLVPSHPPWLDHIGHTVRQARAPEGCGSIGSEDRHGGLDRGG